MASKKPAGPLALHLVLLGCSGALVGAIALARSLNGAATVVPRPAPLSDVGVEHAAPLTLRLRATDGRAPGLLELSHDGAETLGVSVPEGWTLREVRGAPMAAVPADAPVAGFRRWHVPPGAVLGFQTPDAVRLRIHNPSGVPLLVRHERVSLSAGATQADSVLMTKEDAEIW